MVHIATDTSTKPRAVGLFVRGQLDLTAVSAFRESLTRATRTSRAVEIHLGDVDFIDGSGLSMLIEAMARARKADYEISIVDASDCVRRLIEITDTADRLAPLPIESVVGRAKADDSEEVARMTSGAVHRYAFRT
jgi:anti-sigma B factor antagonist